MVSDTTLAIIKTVPMPSVGTTLAFGEYLKFVYGIMTASVPLLELGVLKARGALREYYAKHLEEERHHDDWMVEDMKTLDLAPPKIDHAVAAICGSQHYYLHHVGPHALLGYMAAIESRPMPMADVDALAKLHGAAALRTIRYHATNDIDHSRDLAQMIDAHQEFADLICYSAFCTVKMCAFYLGEKINAARAAQGVNDA